MAVLWGLIVIAFAALSLFFGVTVSPLRFEGGLISREQDPASFRKAVGVHVVVGLLFIIGWFLDHYWHIFQ
jgi:Na+/H+ antiporter NhaD/arsenite permease-like protein